MEAQIIEVTAARNRSNLSMKALQPEPEVVEKNQNRRHVKIPERYNSDKSGEKSQPVNHVAALKMRTRPLWLRSTKRVEPEPTAMELAMKAAMEKAKDKKKNRNHAKRRQVQRTGRHPLSHPRD